MEINIFEITPWKFNVKSGNDKWKIMYLKYDPASEIFPEVFEKSELRRGLLKPAINRDTDTPAKRAQWLIDTLLIDHSVSHCYYSN